MFAHNPNPQELIKGANNVMRSKGYFLIENAYAVDTFLHGEIDQIYHEHMFYFSLQSIKNLMDLHGFYLVDFLTTDVHGGSLVYIFSNDPTESPAKKVTESLAYEQSLFEEKKIFKIFNEKIASLKNNVKSELAQAIAKDKKIIVYGAPAKAFTMFTYLNLNSDDISFCVDTTETKIGKIFPIFNIPILCESELTNQEYDVVLVCAWNYQEEILLKSNRLFKIGEKVKEKVWRLPLHDNYDKLINSTIADMQNINYSGGAGSIAAAQFLQRFVTSKTPWAHLDIAGMAFSKKAANLNPGGATGFGVRLLNQLIEEHYE